MRRTLPSLVGLLVFVLVCLGVSTASADPVSTDPVSVDPAESVSAAPAPAASGVETEVLNRLNELRVSVGAGPLVADPQLTAVAQRWAASMAASGSLLHNAALSREVPVGYSVVAENVGAGTNLDIIDRYLRESPAHYQNMVDPRFDKVGIGVVVAPNGRYYVVQDFTAS